MEDLTLALITLTSFVLLFVVAIFADRAGLDAEEKVAAGVEPIRASAEEAHSSQVVASRDADVA
jgi:hypothetical protein